MRAKKHNRHRFRLIKAIAVLLLVAGVAVYINVKKDRLLAEWTRFIETTLSRATDLDVKIGRIRGNVFGSLRLEGVVVRKPWLEGKEEPAFKADEIRLDYRFLDFLSKRFDSKVVISIKRPELRWSPQLGLRRPSFPFLGWMREWALARKESIVVRFEDLSFIFGPDRRELHGIDLLYHDSQIELDIPVSHLELQDLDISTVFRIEGRYETDGVRDVIKGRIRTEGSVVNWRPMPVESKFDFIFTKDRLDIGPADLLGGIQVVGSVDFTKDYELDATIHTENFGVANLDLLLNTNLKSSSPYRIDLDASFKGSVLAPSVTAKARVYGGHVGRRAFKAMDIYVTGVYPSLRLEDSRILMDDGVAMRFAEKTLEVQDLFSNKTYESLIAEARQDTLVWGDWEFIHPRSEVASGANAQPGSQVPLRPFSSTDRSADSMYTEKERMEVGFEYRLRSKDSLQVKVRDEDEFVGVERKLTF